MEINIRPLLYVYKPKNGIDRTKQTSGYFVHYSLEGCYGKFIWKRKYGQRSGCGQDGPGL
jgi:hypothetical protein